MLKRSVPLLVTAGYLSCVQVFMGLRTEHLLLAGFLTLLYYTHVKGREFVTDFFPFALFGALYDFLRVIPKEWAGPIHVVWPYRLELFLFGFRFKERMIIPNDYFLEHHHAFFDLAAAAAYSLHMVVPLFLAFLFWKRDRMLTRRFAWAFFLANLFAFVTYVALPVAPPWYVQQYGLTPATWETPSSAAGLIHFDRWIGIPYFQGMYSKSAWVFGAVPSMHAGFPFLNVLFARKVFRMGLIPLILFMLLVWFSAVYLRHHYIIDLIAGVVYVSIAYCLMNGWHAKTLSFSPIRLKNYPQPQADFMRCPPHDDRCCVCDQQDQDP